jgi:predicted site-specific integrase-resolvase
MLRNTALPRRPRWLEVKEAAPLIGHNAATLRRLLRAGLLPSVKAARTWRIHGGFVYDVVSEVEQGRQVVLEEYAASWMAATSGDGQRNAA